MTRGLVVGLTLLLVMAATPTFAQSIGGRSLPVRGGKAAVVEIVEVSDFQCSYCAKAQKTLKALARAYPDQLRFVFLHQPLAFHERALPAALASVVLQEEGKFWEFADTLFLEQEQMSAVNTQRIALGLGVEGEALSLRMKRPETQAFVEANQRVAEALGPRGTPAFFINGTPLRGAQPLEKFKRIVELEAAFAGKGKLSVEDARTYRNKRTQANNAKLYAYLYEGKIPAPPVPAGAAPATPAEGPLFKVTLRADDPMRGDSTKALVTVVGFVGYACAYSRKVMKTYDALQEHYGDAVRLVLKQLPLAMHQDGDTAALAALCAHEQDMFWAMNKQLFADGRLSSSAIRRKARQAGLDIKTYDACMDSDTPRQRLREDRSLARLVAARGTPMTYVNGRRIMGAVPLDHLQATVDAELERVRAQVAAGKAVGEIYSDILARAELLEPLAETVTRLDLTGSPTLGPANAQVKLVVFSDYQCPYCAMLEPSLKELVKRYAGRLSVTFKHYPLSFHRLAREAAAAAHCADEQGKFWLMHDALYAGQEHLSAAFIFETAQALPLDMEAFEACTKSPKTAARVQADVAVGDRAGIRGTPSLFFNGRRYDLAFGGSPDDLAQTVQQVLDGPPAEAPKKRPAAPGRP